MKLRSTNTFRTSLSLAFAATLMTGTFVSFARERKQNSATEAEALAADFRDNPKTADATWRDKHIVVTGTIQRIIPGDNTTKVAQIALKTGEGLPLVKVDFATISDLSTTYEFRINNGKTLEVRTRQKNMFPTTSMFPGFTPKQRSAPWNVLLNVGDKATFSGQCRGRIMDVVVANGALMKQGWNVGGGAMIAGGGGGGGGSYDPQADIRRFETHQQVQMQNQQMNMQMNQQNSMQQMQQMMMNQRR